MFGNISQTYAETTAAGSASDNFLSQVMTPMLTAQIGLSYTPPVWTNCHFMTGYVWEEIWQIGRFGFTDANADLLNRGLFLRAELSF